MRAASRVFHRIARCDAEGAPCPWPGWLALASWSLVKPLLASVVVAVLGVLLVGRAVAQEGSQEGAEEPRGRLIGRVVDTLGEPVPAAEVWITEDRLPLMQARTDGSGTFLFANVPLGSFEVHARAAGRTHARGPVALSRAVPLRAVELRSFDAVRLAGRVLGADGGPVRSAIVTVRSLGKPIERDLGFVVTGADGAYDLPHAPLGEIELVAFAPGHAVHREPMHVVADARRDLQLVGGPPQRLVVRLRGVPEELLRDARCSVSFAHGGRELLLPAFATEARFDARGECVLADLPSDVAIVATDVRVPGIEVGRQGPAQLTERNTFLVEYRSAPGVCELRGRLLDAAGNGIASGVRVVVDDREIVLPTDEMGNFRATSPVVVGRSFELLPADPRLVRRLYPRTQRFAPQGLGETYVRSRRYEVRAVPGAEVTGRLLDAAGRAAPGVHVWLEALVARIGPRGHFQGVAWAVTDADGRYRLRVDPDTAVDLRVSAWHPDPVRSEAFTLDGAETTVPDLSAAARGRVEGTLRGPDGAPLPGALVVLRPPQGHVAESFETQTDRQGRFAFPAVPPGPRQLACSPLPSRNRVPPPQTEVFEVAVGATLRRDLVAD